MTSKKDDYAYPVGRTDYRKGMTVYEVRYNTVLQGVLSNPEITRSSQYSEACEVVELAKFITDESFKVTTEG